MCKLIIISFLLLSGCRTITFEAEGKKVTYTNFLFDTKAGAVDVVTPEGVKIHIENLDTNSNALTVANKALDVTSSVLSKVP